MTTKEKEQRIKHSKLFLEKFKYLKEEIAVKEQLINDLIESQKPSDYKQNLQIQNVKVQTSKKNQNTEEFLNYFNDSVENLKKEIEKLTIFKLNGIRLISKLKDTHERIIITHYYILCKPQKEYKKISKSNFFKILEMGLINFSYILQEEYRSKKDEIEKNKIKEEKTDNPPNISDISDTLKKENNNPSFPRP